MNILVTKKRNLLYQQSKKAKKRSWKKFSKMNPEEKKERITYLWKRVRTHARTLGFIRATQKEMESQFLKEFAQETEFNEEYLNKSHSVDMDKKRLPWYLIRES